MTALAPKYDSDAFPGDEVTSEEQDDRGFCPVVVEKTPVPPGQSIDYAEILSKRYGIDLDFLKVCEWSSPGDYSNWKWNLKAALFQNPYSNILLDDRYVSGAFPVYEPLGKLSTELVPTNYCVDYSPSETQPLSKAATEFVKPVEQPQQIVGAKAEAFSRLDSLAAEYATDKTTAIDSFAISLTKSFLRALPSNISLPEFSVEPGGSISLDWIESRDHVFSLTVGAKNRLAFAWLDGTNQGHGVEEFDGQRIPKRLIDSITAVSKD